MHDSPVVFSPKRVPQHGSPPANPVKDRVEELESTLSTECAHVRTKLSQVLTVVNDSGVTHTLESVLRLIGGIGDPSLSVSYATDNDTQVDAAAAAAAVDTPATPAAATAASDDGALPSTPPAAWDGSDAERCIQQGLTRVALTESLLLEIEGARYGRVCVCVGGALVVFTCLPLYMYFPAPSICVHSGLL